MRWRMMLLAGLPALVLAASFWLGSNPPSCVPVEPDEPAACTDAECGPAPLCPARECPDGSLGGCTGRCFRDDAGQCGWEVRDCPNPCADIPMCALACPPGTHNPVDANGCVHTCECVPNAGECTQDECGPAPDCPVYECPDGSLGGCTDRCFRNADGRCGWEVRECPDPCAGIPVCDLACPPGTHNPVNDRGCVLSCECVPDAGECTRDECGPPPLCPAYECPDGSLGGCTGRCFRNAAGQCGWEVRDCPDPCAGIPECDLACPPGTHNPVDDNGCVHSCECVPNTGECTSDECGPAPDCPVYECPDGSLGGCTDRCYRNADGRCVWEVRECPPVNRLSWYETCGDPVCRGWTPGQFPLCTTQTAGAACEREGARCDLENNGCNVDLVCAAADPRLQGCPISRQAFKQDIRYLTPADRDRFRDELLGFRLATYRYRGAPERLQLGFVIENQEPSAAIDTERDMVDLYGYTSMVVATLQAQSEEIATLRKEMAALQARLAEPRP